MSEFNFDDLMTGMKQAVAISKGESAPSRKFTISPLDIQKIRSDANKTQLDFARMIGVSVGTLRNWEQGRRKPDGAALTLLKIVSANPKYVESVLYN